MPSEIGKYFSSLITSWKNFSSPEDQVLWALSNIIETEKYHNDPEFSDRYAWANGVDPDQEQSDQGLHYLPFRLHRLDSLLYSNFRVITTIFLGVRIFRKFTVMSVTEPYKRKILYCNVDFWIRFQPGWQMKWARAWQNQQNDLCAQWRLRSAWASAQSDQSLRCLHEECLGH